MITILPGDIPGLLRRGSPVVRVSRMDAPSVVITLGTVAAKIGYPWSIDDEDVDTHWVGGLALDLNDATGRAHAAWWCRAQPVPWGDLTSYEVGTLQRFCGYAEQQQQFQPAEVDSFARLVLRLAGRTP